GAAAPSCSSRSAPPPPRSAPRPRGPAPPPTATAARASGSPDHLARQPGQVRLEPTVHRQGEQLGYLVRVTFPHRPAQRLPLRHVGLEQHDHLALLGHLALPAVNRTPAGNERPARYQPLRLRGC